MRDPDFDDLDIAAIVVWQASMVSNLLVVLCGDQPPSPVVNTGSLYT